MAKRSTHPAMASNVRKHSSKLLLHKLAILALVIGVCVGETVTAAVREAAT